MTTLFLRRAQHGIGPLALRRALAAGCVALATLCASPAQAGALDQLKAFTAGTKTARGDFVQRIERGGAAARSQSGTFAFARPGKFRWSYAKPFEQLLVADGQKLWIYDKDLDQVTVRKLGSALGDSPAAILFGSNDLERNFTLKETGEHDGLDWLDATPKLKDSSFERVSIGFRDGLPQVMELRDAFGQVSRLSFGKIERNPALPAETFIFTPPKGAEVLEQ
ncbi:outer membrane lipoprotein chaperone LolA [Derxia lacustris]|uniref:outer membrane lipoprotein chaperone LolA n=1 Tax=Derxia lacustris TaxID=764842 RepID=UPI000A17368B|nr:outer membrane lipoprotein chaperone LolA [Derxia lacustris]